MLNITTKPPIFIFKDEKTIIKLKNGKEFPIISYKVLNDVKNTSLLVMAIMNSNYLFLVFIEDGKNKKLAHFKGKKTRMVCMGK